MPKVHLPMAAMATAGEKTIYLLMVEQWRNQVVVRLVGAPTWRDEPDVEAKAGPEDWEEAPKAMARVRVELSDDVGTRYRPTGGQTGGTDVEWRADWFYRPGIPAEARSLTVRAAGQEITLQVQ